MAKIKPSIYEVDRLWVDFIDLTKKHSSLPPRFLAVTLVSFASNMMYDLCPFDKKEADTRLQNALKIGLEASRKNALKKEAEIK